MLYDDAGQMEFNTDTPDTEAYDQNMSACCRQPVLKSNVELTRLQRLGTLTALSYMEIEVRNESSSNELCSNTTKLFFNPT